MKKSILVTSIVAVVIIAALVAAFVMTSSPSGKLVLQITDQPTDLDISRVDVTLSMIEVHRSNSGGNDSNESEAGWITIVDGPVTYDLIAIKDVKELLGSVNLEPGKYTQIRLHVDSAVGMINGVESTLEIPSQEIKLTNNFDIVEGETTTITLDFDAQQSISEGPGETYMMHPTIMVIEEE